MSKQNVIKNGFINLGNRDIFYRYRSGTSDIFISFLHGYPTSSLDYQHLMDRIPSKYHVLAHDHLGFGRSDKPIESDYSLFEQADIALELYDVFDIKHLHIVAHDYGTSVATEIIVRHNEGKVNVNIRSVTLCNGSMLIDMAKLRLIQRLLKSRWTGRVVAFLSSEYTFQSNMKNIWFDKRKYSSEEMKRHWNLLIDNNGKKVLPKITRYIDQRYANYERWIGGLAQSKLPFHIFWAANDPVAVVAMAYKLEEIISNSVLTILDDCGHYPMIEKEEEWTKHIVNFINDLIQHN